MPNTREKLIELLETVVSPNEVLCNGEVLVSTARVADHLIANGVTFANDNNVVHKWIPVTDGMPELIPCDAGTAYSEAVNVLTSGRKVLTAIWDGFDWTCDAEFWDAEDEEITHWTPVLLPLPQPPKEMPEETVYCKDCENLMFSDCYGECAKAYKGIVRPDDTCEHGVRRTPKGE